MNKLGHFFNVPIVFPEWQDTSARRATGGIDQNDFNDVISGDAPASPKKNGGSTVAPQRRLKCAVRSKPARKRLRALAKRYGVNHKTLRRRKKCDFVSDIPLGLLIVPIAATSEMRPNM